MNANIWKKIERTDGVESPNPIDMPGAYIYAVCMFPYYDISELFAKGHRWIEERQGINYDGLGSFSYWCTKDEFFQSFEDQAK